MKSLKNTVLSIFALKLLSFLPLQATNPDVIDPFEKKQFSKYVHENCVPLVIAALDHTPGLMNILFDDIGPLPHKIIWTSGRRGNMEAMMQEILERGYDINRISPPLGDRKIEMTPLAYALWQAPFCDSWFRFLIDRGADPFHPTVQAVLADKIANKKHLLHRFMNAFYSINDFLNLRGSPTLDLPGVSLAENLTFSNVENRYLIQMVLTTDAPYCGKEVKVFYKKLPADGDVIFTTLNQGAGALFLSLLLYPDLRKTLHGDFLNLFGVDYPQVLGFMLGSLMSFSNTELNNSTRLGLSHALQELRDRPEPFRSLSEYFEIPSIPDRPAAHHRKMIRNKHIADIPQEKFEKSRFERLSCIEQITFNNGILTLQGCLLDSEKQGEFSVLTPLILESSSKNNRQVFKDPFTIVLKEPGMQYLALEVLLGKRPAYPTYAQMNSLLDLHCMLSDQFTPVKKEDHWQYPGIWFFYLHPGLNAKEAIEPKAMLSPAAENFAQLLYAKMLSRM